MGEHLLCTQGVVGSNPSISTSVFKGLRRIGLGLLARLAGIWPGRREMRRGDPLHGLVALSLGDVVWHEAGRHEHSGTFHGIDAVLKAVAGSAQESWQSFSLDVHDVLSNGAHTVALVNWQGTSKRDGQGYSGHSVLFAHLNAAAKLAKVWVIWEDPAQLEQAHQGA